MNLLRLLLTLAIFDVINAADPLPEEELKRSVAFYNGQIDKIVTVRDALEGFNAMLPSIVLGCLFLGNSPSCVQNDLCPADYLKTVGCSTAFIHAGIVYSVKFCNTIIKNREAKIFQITGKPVNKLEDNFGENEPNNEPNTVKSKSE